LKGSVLIVLLFVIAATSIVLIAASSIMEAHFFVSQTDDLHQAAYYLAETGANSAIAELTRITEQVHQECLSDFADGRQHREFQPGGQWWRRQ
jgi:ribonuclease HIII